MSVDVSTTDKWARSSIGSCEEELEVESVIEKRFDFETSKSPNYNISEPSSGSLEIATVRSMWLEEEPDSGYDMRLSILLTTKNDEHLVEFPIGSSDFWDTRIESFFTTLNLSSDEVADAIGAQVYLYESNSPFTLGDKFVMTNEKPNTSRIANFSGVFIMVGSLILGGGIFELGFPGAGLSIFVALLLLGAVIGFGSFIYSDSDDISDIDNYYGREVADVLGK